MGTCADPQALLPASGRAAQTPGAHSHVVNQGSCLCHCTCKSKPFFCCSWILGHFQIHMDFFKSVPKHGSRGQITAPSTPQWQFLEKSEQSGKRSCWSGVQFYDSFSLLWRSVAQREKSVSVTGKHLLMRNKKQKPPEPLTEQAIRKAFRKVRINHRRSGTSFKKIRLIWFFQIIFHSCLSMQVYHMPISEASPQGNISWTHRFFCYVQSYLIIGKTLSFTNYMYKERESEREKETNLHISAYILKKKDTIHF